MDKQTCKLIARISENLPDMSPKQMQYVIESPGYLQEFLKTLARVPDRIEGVASDIWMTVKVFPRTPADMTKTLRTAEMEVSRETRAFLDKNEDLVMDLERRNIEMSSSIRGLFKYAPDFTADEVIEYNLVRRSVAQLGFADSSFGKICQKAQENGLAYCPWIVAYYVRKEYKQLKGEILFLGMETITDSSNQSRIFVIESSPTGSLRLRSEQCSRKTVFKGTDEFIFVKPRK